MKNTIIFFSLMAFLICSVLKAQTTATDFTANDCKGVSHTLFNDLDAGKVVVIVWVMPCASCINGALTAQTEVQTALSANPGKVVFYLADDDGGTNCNTLNGWATANGLTQPIVISSNKVQMTSYGTAGMPKVVVLGGLDHKIVYNQNDAKITASGIRSGIAQAMASVTGVPKARADFQQDEIFPNPTNINLTVRINNPDLKSSDMEIIDALGNKVLTGEDILIVGTENKAVIEVGSLENGSYFLKITVGNNCSYHRFIVMH